MSVTVTAVVVFTVANGFALSAIVVEIGVMS